MTSAASDPVPEPSQAPAPAPSQGSMSAARSTVEALVDAGVEHVVLCPGSRSAPLAYALAEAQAREEVEVHVRLDERDAGFVALGLSAATGRPVAVATTSGTAVGELLPAVMEADHAGVPLVVLSADRPAELHGTGANQTTRQAGLFGVHVRLDVDVQAGEDPAADVRRALLAADGLLAFEDEAGVGLRNVPRGPVQVNLAFRDPLVPAEDSKMPRAGTVPSTLHVDAGMFVPDGSDVPDGFAASVHAAASTGTARRTVVVAGHDAGPVAAEFAAAQGLPLLAEPSSDARRGPTAVATYQYLLQRLGREVEAVVVFGRPTLSRPVGTLLARPDVDTALYLTEPAPWFEQGRRRERIVGDLTELARWAGTAPAGWTERWLEADAGVRSAVDAELLRHEEGSGRLTGPGLASTVWEGLGDADLVLGSSRPIRDLDLLAAPSAGPRRVFANRGLAGIDGTLATASGIALATRRRTVALLGDVTFLHDAGGLLTPTLERVPRLDVVVAQDDGGTIFSTLEHGSVGARGPYADAVERFFRTPHGVAAAPVAAAYGWETATASSRADVTAWLRSGEDAAPDARRLLEVPVEAADPRGLHQRLAAAAASSLG